MFVLAHRGYKAKYPENTILSFKKALEYGADGIELDVRKCSDGTLVVFHDPYVELDGEYKIILNTSYDELSKFNIDGEKIPTFSQVLKELRNLKETIFLDVELKLSEIADEVLELLIKYEYANFIISSFMREELADFKSKHPYVPVGFIFSENELLELKSNTVEYMIDELKKLKIFKRNYVVIPMKACDEYTISDLLRLKDEFKVKIGIWNVNDESQYKKVENLVDLLITDEVEKIVSLRCSSR